jgi:2-phospho-L-lactate/phosphoenolpyruvate guanylyltransferase
MVWALVPVKDLVLAKSRLSGVLAPTERRSLAQAMVEDVLSALANHPGLEGALLVSDDPTAELLAHKYGAEWVAEAQLQSSGLNGAIAAARDYLAERGVDDVMVLHGDIPLLTKGDISALLECYASADTDLVIGPDLAGGGTNTMLMPVQPQLPLHYGVDSCPAHQNAAQTLGMQVRILERETIGLDVDSPADLLMLYHCLQEKKTESNCSKFLGTSDIGQRLLAMERSGLGSGSGPDSEAEADTAINTEQHDII